MLKNVFLLLTLTLLSGWLSAACAQEETITISTYYPAPYGVYNQMVTQTLGVGDNDGSGNLGSSDAPDPGNPLQRGDVWIAGDVGIGTASPQARLEVAGNIRSGGNRTYLIGKDGPGYHWIMAGGDVEGTHNALGFRTVGANRKVIIDNGWNLVARDYLVAAQGLRMLNWAILEGAGGALRFERSGILEVRMNVDGTVDEISDISRKKDIKNLSKYGLNSIMLMRPVEFRWKNDNSQQIGFIAQEMKKIIPEVVNGEEGEMGISYASLTVVLSNALQELNKILQGQKEQIEELKSTLCLHYPQESFCP